MQHSEAYNSFIRQVNATGYAKLHGFDMDLFENIYDFERDEVEEILITLFKKGDWQDLRLMPKLTKVDGVALMENDFPNLKNPSLIRAEFANVLLKATNNKYYEDALYETLKAPDNVTREFVMSFILSYKPSQRLFETCKELCEHDNSRLVRFLAATGLLYCAGMIDDPNNIEPYRYLIDRLKSNDIEERKKAFIEFNNLNKSNFK